MRLSFKYEVSTFFFDLTNNLFLIVETVLNEGRPLQTRFTNHSINIGNFEAQIYQSFVLDLLSIGKNAVHKFSLLCYS